MKKNITFSAEERLISKAREKASKNKQTLNEAFREWLTQYASSDAQIVSYSSLMARLKHVEAGNSFSRDD